MEIILVLIFVVAFNEWRDIKARQKAKHIEGKLSDLSDRLLYVGTLAEQIKANSEAIKAIGSDLEPVKAFINKAHTDLDTIVKEYEVNGIPLGFDRTGGKHYDMVEGL